MIMIDYRRGHMRFNNLALGVALILGLGLIGCNTPNTGEKSSSSDLGSVAKESGPTQDHAAAPEVVPSAPVEVAVVPAACPTPIAVPAPIPLPPPPGIPPVLFGPWNGGLDSGHGHSHKSQECHEDSDCQDDNPCSVDNCDGGKCLNIPILGCAYCVADANCGIIDACTESICSENVCQYISTLGCAPCNQASDCADGDPCTTESCVAGRCDYTPVPGCAFCSIDSDCLPGPTCTTATCDANVCTYPLTPGCIFLVAIAVTPANDSISQGTELQYTATGIFSDASTIDLTNVVSWNSSNPGVATISNAPGTQGLATAIANGTTNITATFGSIVGGTTLTVGCQNPPSNLLGWWPGNNTPNDVVGGNNGVFPAANYDPNGEVLQAFNFIGSSAANDIVTISPATAFEPQQITVDAWVKASGTPGNFKYLVVKNLNNNVGSYGLYSDTNGGLTFYVSDSVTPQKSGNIAPASIWDGNWHFVAGTYDGIVVNLYVDGVLVPGGTATNIAIPYNSGDLVFGAFPADLTLGYTGGLDEVEIFSRALTPSEILSIYNAGSLGKCLP